MNDDNSFRFNIGFLVSILVGLIILMIVIAPVKNNESNSTKCINIKKLMLDDPEYNRLHGNHSNILNDFEEYANDKCNSNEDSDKQ